ncbi:MAG: hypothetical protein EOO96_00095 [Pedobacter sp.]|nr:MAG: hypothetical protein EOO96_00095 [Pedobacter sp.]
MNINALRNRPDIANDVKLSGLYVQFEQLLKELNAKQLTPIAIDSINKDVEEINASTYAGNELRKLVKQKQTAILKLVENEFKFAPKNYYRNLWMILGFTAFGLPIGMLFGLSMKNMGLMGIGLPIGMAIGAVVGTSMDKKTLNEGRQLDLEIKY